VWRDAREYSVTHRVQPFGCQVRSMPR
jgi:hypothetical protein